MSWLDTHLRDFVLPGLKEIWVNRKGLCNCGQMECSWNGKGIEAHTLMPVTCEIIPYKKCVHREAGIVYSWARSIGIPEEELKPLLDTTKIEQAERYFTGPHCTEGIDNFRTSPRAQVIHSFIKSSLRGLKNLSDESGISLVLTGRDMWPWEVLARKMGIATIYDPRISRNVAGSQGALYEAVCSWGLHDLNRSVIFDTGFAGTIWRAICQVTGDKPKNIMVSATDSMAQQWKNMNKSCARQVAFCVEDTPKYHRSGKVTNPYENPKPYQTLGDRKVFIDTIALTIWMWYYQSPSVILSDKQKAAALKYTLKKDQKKKTYFSNRILIKSSAFKAERKRLRRARRAMKAREAFLATLSEEQKTKAIVTFNSIEETTKAIKGKLKPVDSSVGLTTEEIDSSVPKKICASCGSSKCKNAK